MEVANSETEISSLVVQYIEAHASLLQQSSCRIEECYKPRAGATVPLIGVVDAQLLE